MSNLEGYNRARRQYLRREITSGDFLSLRDKIAEQLLGGDPGVVNHFARRSARLWPYSQKYDRHFIDGVPFPGLHEAIYATLKIKEVADQVAINFSSVSGLMQVGSFAWGAYYAPRMSEVSEHVATDLDYEVIVEGDTDWKIVESTPLIQNDPKVSRGFSRFRQLYEQGSADYFSHKTVIGGVKVSLHVTPFSTIRDLCEFKVADFEGVATFREHRVIPKTTPPLYNLSNFRRGRYPFDCVVEQNGDLIVTHTPKQVVVRGELYPGVLANKLLHHPVILRDRLGLTEQVWFLTRNMVQRIILEERRFGDQRSLVLGLVGSTETPQHIINRLNFSEQEARMEISTSNDQ